ncbi:hypothetical protein N339_06752, partial [Pterocles gutturalis]
SYHSLKHFQRQLQQYKSIHTESHGSADTWKTIVLDSFQLYMLSLLKRTCGGSVIVKDFENRNLAKLLLLHDI